MIHTVERSKSAIYSGPMNQQGPHHKNKTSIPKWVHSATQWLPNEHQLREINYKELKMYYLIHSFIFCTLLFPSSRLQVFFNMHSSF